MSLEIWVKGGLANAPGIHTRQRRPRAQSEEHRDHHSQGQAGGDHRGFRFREEFPGLRHHLRRGPAALRGVAVGLRAAVPGADGQAGRRLHRGAVPGDFHRPEGGVAQPALHGGHGDRDIRLPAAAVRPDRPSALLEVRPAGGTADGIPDRRRHHQPGRGQPHHAAGPQSAPQEGRTQRRVRVGPKGGVRPHTRQRPDPHAGRDRQPEPEQAEVALHRAGGRPLDHTPRHRTQPGGRIGGDLPAGGRRRHGGAARGRRHAGLFGEVFLRPVRHQPARDRAADLQLQQSPRGLLRVHRAGLQAGHRPGPGHIQQGPLPVARRHHPVDQGRPLQRVVYQPDGVGGASQRLLLQDTGQRPDPRRTGPGALRQPVQENHGEAPHPPGPDLLLGHHLRRGDSQPGAALQDDRVGLHALADRTLYVGPHLPAVRGQAPAAGGPGGKGMRAGHHGRLLQEHRQGDGVGAGDRPRPGK